jgi:hypothetical protein
MRHVSSHEVWTDKVQRDEEEARDRLLSHWQEVYRAFLALFLVDCNLPYAEYWPTADCQTQNFQSADFMGHPNHDAENLKSLVVSQS